MQAPRAPSHDGGVDQAFRWAKKKQLADILTKGSFTADSWNVLMKLCLIVPLSERTYKDKTLKSLK